MTTGTSRTRPTRQLAGFLSRTSPAELTPILHSTTHGQVQYVDQGTASNEHLAYVNSAGHAIIAVDDTTNLAAGALRNSVRITSRQTYSIGSLVIADFTHSRSNSFKACEHTLMLVTHSSLWMVSDIALDCGALESVSLTFSSLAPLGVRFGCSVSFHLIDLR